ncbi:hypothetical protein, partial [Asanoa sp. NPDC050611]|uniref:hypothetical protein n=1 Tax=Asanoa sp. NPDC050611 TaxID=3157098 RepID=UPI0033DAC98E
ELDPAVTRIAVGLAVIGFGGKAGLIPLHAWLPPAGAARRSPTTTTTTSAPRASAPASATATAW